MGSQALVDLLDPFLRLSLVRQCPAVQERTDRHQERKTLFRGKANGGFGVLLGCLHLLTQLMEHSRPAQGMTQAKGVCHLLRQDDRLIVPHLPLVRIAQRPQRPCSITTARHTRILPMQEPHTSMVVRVVQAYSLRQMRVCRGYHA